MKTKHFCAKSSMLSDTEPKNMKSGECVSDLDFDDMEVTGCTCKEELCNGAEIFQPGLIIALVAAIIVKCF